MRREDANAAFARAFDSLPPQTRLADPGLALEEERTRTGAQTRQEVVDLREFRLPPYDGLDCDYRHLPR
jgi:hypothetical protein